MIKLDVVKHLVIVYFKILKTVSTLSMWNMPRKLHLRKNEDRIERKRQHC